MAGGTTFIVIVITTRVYFCFRFTTDCCCVYEWMNGHDVSQWVARVCMHVWFCLYFMLFARVKFYFNRYIFKNTENYLYKFATMRVTEKERSPKIKGSKWNKVIKMKMKKSQSKRESNKNWVVWRKKHNLAVSL